MTRVQPLPDAEAYRARALATLGDRDPVVVQAGLLPGIEKALAGLSPEALRTPEKPGKWSIAQTIQHLADTELVFGYRIRLLLCEPEPLLPSFDENLWIQALGDADARAEDALDLLRAVRTSNLRLIRGLDTARLGRMGTHQERGPESLGLTLKLIAAHDLVHLAQIARIRKTLGA